MQLLPYPELPFVPSGKARNMTEILEEVVTSEIQGLIRWKHARISIGYGGHDFLRWHSLMRQNQRDLRRFGRFLHVL